MLAIKYDYPFERFVIETSDSYMLQAFRISGPKHSSPLDIYKPGNSRPAVIYQHGIFDSADGFMCLGQDSLAFKLADAGYDVWMVNSRGNRHSLNNRYMDTNDADFWDFSFQEIAQFDLPASIHFVLKLTGQKQVSFIGHSLGSSAMFAALATNPELAFYINLFIALAPLTKITNPDKKI